MTKNAKISLRLTNKQRNSLEKIANSEGMVLSEIMILIVEKFILEYENDNLSPYIKLYEKINNLEKFIDKDVKFLIRYLVKIRENYER